MILTIDRTAWTICGGGVVISAYPDGSPERYWCMAAIRQGYDLGGMRIEVWDRGCNLGRYVRTTPMHILNIPDAAKFMNPPPKPKKAALAAREGGR
jgi:hypothetical protein